MKNNILRIVIVCLLSLFCYNMKLTAANNSILFCIDKQKKNINFVTLNNIKYVSISKVIDLINDDVVINKNSIYIKNNNLEIYYTCDNFYIYFVNKENKLVLQLGLPTACINHKVYVPIYSFVQALGNQLNFKFDLLDNSIFIETNNKYLTFWGLIKEEIPQIVSNQKDIKSKEIENVKLKQFMKINERKGFPQLSTLDFSKNFISNIFGISFLNFNDSFFVKDISTKNILKLNVNKSQFHKNLLENVQFPFIELKNNVELQTNEGDKPNRRYSVPDNLIKKGLEELQGEE